MCLCVAIDEQNFDEKRLKSRTKITSSFISEKAVCERNFDLWSGKGNGIRGADLDYFTQDGTRELTQFVLCSQNGQKRFLA